MNAGVCSLEETLRGLCRARGWKAPWPFTPPVSGLEERFTVTLKGAAPGAAWSAQVKVATRACDFWIDLVGGFGGRTIGVECDGDLYHPDALRDLCRDALILEAGRVAAVYRVREFNVNENLIGVLHTLGVLEPGLFTAEKMATVRGLHRAFAGLRGSAYGCRPFLTRHTTGTRLVREFLDFTAGCPIRYFPALVEAFRKTLPVPERT